MTDGPQALAKQDSCNARPVALRANSRVARGPNTRLVQTLAAIRREAVRVLPERDRDSVRVQALELHVPALAHAQALAVRRRPVKLHARSALRRVAVAVDSSNTPRPKKAR